ncbi:alpha/beta hydrolase [uncultured Deinococcus sp.]|uniref:alpha/beta fold hydrolase n=1 Tax=uncultured Deinococcus sp. TaxID=158789 RepID=UPI0025E22018|nr:alpha/beta hydrolase [uncultured Deinococcus sp.]
MNRGASGRALFLDVHGLRTHAWVRGQGRPLVIVPGLGCASWMYVRVARELAAHRTVYVYDPPGHGYSEGTWAFPVCIQHLTDHLAAWLHVAGLEGCDLFGHSLGGEVVFDLAARYPSLTTAVVACAPTGIPENPSVPVQLLRLLRDLPRERLSLLVPGMRAYAHCGPRRMALLAHDQSFHDTGPLLRRVEVPTLLLDGLSDPVIRSWTVEAIREAIPGAVIREIAGGTHALTDSHPRVVARYTIDFLNALNS